MMTAVSNDVGTEHVITRQLSALANCGDTLVVFSTSGNSANLIEACKKARAMDLSVIAFTGRTGGEHGCLYHRTQRQYSPHSGVSPGLLSHFMGSGAQPAG